jgi:amino acid transporter
MVNVAEEVKDVRKVLPQAILATLICTVVIYLTLTLVLVLSVRPEDLAGSEAPLADLYGRLTGRSTAWISLVGVLAMTNGALIQIIKASRIVYGLADQGQLPAVFARLAPRRRTPVIATILVAGIATALALSAPIEHLAEATSIVTLGVFGFANLALVLLKRRGPAPDGVAPVPLAVPLAGFLVSAGFLAFELFRRI